MRVMELTTEETRRALDLDSRLGAAARAEVTAHNERLEAEAAYADFRLDLQKKYRIRCDGLWLDDSRTYVIGAALEEGGSAIVNT